MSSGEEQGERGPQPLLAGMVRRYCGYDHGGSRLTRRREVAEDGNDAGLHRLMKSRG